MKYIHHLKAIIFSKILLAFLPCCLGIKLQRVSKILRLLLISLTLVPFNIIDICCMFCIFPEFNN